MVFLISHFHIATERKKIHDKRVPLRKYRMRKIIKKSKYKKQQQTDKKTKTTVKLKKTKEKKKLTD